MDFPEAEMISRMKDNVRIHFLRQALRQIEKAVDSLKLADEDGLVFSAHRLEKLITERIKGGTNEESDNPEASDNQGMGTHRRVRNARL